jgi:hypothetical protein
MAIPSVPILARSSTSNTGPTSNELTLHLDRFAQWRDGDAALSGIMREASEAIKKVLERDSQAAKRNPQLRALLSVYKKSKAYMEVKKVLEGCGESRRDLPNRILSQILSTDPCQIYSSNPIDDLIKTFDEEIKPQVLDYQKLNKSMYENAMSLTARTLWSYQRLMGDMQKRDGPARDELRLKQLLGCDPVVTTRSNRGAGNASERCGSDIPVARLRTELAQFRESVKTLPDGSSLLRDEVTRINAGLDQMNTSLVNIPVGSKEIWLGMNTDPDLPDASVVSYQSYAQSYFELSSSGLGTFLNTDVVREEVGSIRQMDEDDMHYLEDRNSYIFKPHQYVNADDMREAYKEVTQHIKDNVKKLHDDFSSIPSRSMPMPLSYESYSTKLAKNTQENIRKMLKHHPVAAAQSLIQFPELSQAMCNEIKTLEQDDQDDEDTDKYLMWGGVIVAAVVIVGTAGAGAVLLGAGGTAVIGTGAATAGVAATSLAVMKTALTVGLVAGVAQTGISSAKYAEASIEHDNAHQALFAGLTDAIGVDEANRAVSDLNSASWELALAGGFTLLDLGAIGAVARLGRGALAARQLKQLTTALREMSIEASRSLRLKQAFAKLSPVKDALGNVAEKLGRVSRSVREKFWKNVLKLTDEQIDEVLLYIGKCDPTVTNGTSVCTQGFGAIERIANATDDELRSGKAVEDILEAQKARVSSATAETGSAAGSRAAAGTPAAPPAALQREMTENQLRQRSWLELRRREVAANPNAPVDVDEFKKVFRVSDDISAAENQRFIDMALKQENAGAAPLYMEVDNAILKQMNDKVFKGDKDLATAMTNYHKEVFLQNASRFKVRLARKEVEQLIGETTNPAVKARLVSMLEKPGATFEVPGEDLVVGVAAYSDYKSMRFAFGVDNPRVRRLMEEIHEDTNRQIGQIMNSSNLNPFLDNPELRGLARDPSRWFNAGFGDTADQASVASRLGRTRVAGDRTIMHFEALRGRLRETLSVAEDNRRRIQTSLIGTKALTRTSNGEYVLSVDAIEVFRKATGSVSDFEKHIDAMRTFMTKTYGREVSLDDILQTGGYRNLDEFAKSYKGDRNFMSYLAEIHHGFQKLGVEVSIVDITRMRSYFMAMDSVAPSLMMAERVVVDVSSARHGLFSVDFGKQGSINIHEQMVEFASSESARRVEDVGEIVDLMRRSEQRATRLLHADMERVNRLYRQNSAPGSSPVRFSGDDGTGIPESALVRGRRVRMYDQIASGAEDPSRYRMVYVGPEYLDNAAAISPNDLKKIIATAEGIEKEVRRRLRDHFGPDELNSFALVSEVRPSSQIQILEGRPVQLNGSDFEMMVAGRGAQNLTPQQMVQIQAAVREVVGRYGVSSNQVLVTNLRRPSQVVAPATGGAVRSASPPGTSINRPPPANPRGP